MSGKTSLLAGVALASLFSFSPFGSAAAEKLSPPSRLELDDSPSRNGDRKPQIRVRIAPEYPPELKRLRFQGSVVMLVELDERGEVARAVATASSHADFTTAAEAAVRKWKFDPALLDGRPVPSRFEFPIAFHLEPIPDGPSDPPPAPAVPIRREPSYGRQGPVSVPAQPAGVIPLEQLDVRPKVLTQVAPKYPRSLGTATLKGRVVVTFVLEETGEVGAILDTQVSHPAFGASAIAALREWKFSPAMKDGQPVKTRLVVPIDFRRE